MMKGPTTSWSHNLVLGPPGSKAWLGATALGLSAVACFTLWYSLDQECGDDDDDDDDCEDYADDCSRNDCTEKDSVSDATKRPLTLNVATTTRTNTSPTSQTIISDEQTHPVQKLVAEASRAASDLFYSDLLYRMADDVIIAIMSHS